MVGDINVVVWVVLVMQGWFLWWFVGYVIDWGLDEY
jgi:hypothetical protein